MEKSIIKVNLYPAALTLAQWMCIPNGVVFEDIHKGGGSKGSTKPSSIRSIMLLSMAKNDPVTTLELHDALCGDRGFGVDFKIKSLKSALRQACDDCLVRVIDKSMPSDHWTWQITDLGRANLEKILADDEQRFVPTRIMLLILEYLSQCGELGFSEIADFLENKGALRARNTYRWSIQEIRRKGWISCTRHKSIKKWKLTDLGLRALEAELKTSSGR